MCTNSSIATLYSSLATIFKSTFCSPSGISDCIYKPASNTPTTPATVAVGDLTAIAGSYWATKTTVAASKIWIENGSR
jgi:hypothetical protein